MGRRAWNDDTLRQEMQPLSKTERLQHEAWQQFCQRLHFVLGISSAPASEAYAPGGPDHAGAEVEHDRAELEHSV